MLMVPFLTQLDSRAAIKGSRDPLGVQAIWTKLGRRVVGNLTTVSNSVQDFSVLLLGYYFAALVAEDAGSEGDLATFLKWEQLAAYARAQAGKELRFRGTERVLKRMGEGGKVTLGLSNDAQILSNQKIYGLWGLYSMPARASGLLGGDPGRLTRPAREFVEAQCLPLLKAAGVRDVETVLALLRPKETSVDLRAGSRDAKLLSAIASAFAAIRQACRPLYREHLLRGVTMPETTAVQSLFGELLVDTSRDSDWSLTPKSLSILIEQARSRGEVGIDLAARLSAIRTAEYLIAPGVALFELVLSQEGKTVAQVAELVRAKWLDAPRHTIDVEQVRGIETWLRPGGDAATGARWLRLAEALHRGDYEDAIHAVVEQNAAVMKARSAAAAWVVIENGTLQVRFRDEQPTHLPKAEELRDKYWRHAYFVGSLRDVALALRGDHV